MLQFIGSLAISFTAGGRPVPEKKNTFCATDKQGKNFNYNVTLNSTFYRSEDIRSSQYLSPI